MKLVLRVGLFLIVVSPLAFVLTTDLFVRTEPRQRPSASPRPIPFRFCPDVSVEAVPSGLSLTNKELRNLGQNVMGRSIEYVGGLQRIWVAVGFDVLDTLEDLDFTEESTSQVDGRTVRISTTDILSGHRLRAGTWEEERFDPPCDEFTVVTWNLTGNEFVRVVSGVTLRA
jgi:hypothetical protein